MTTSTTVVTRGTEAAKSAEEAVRSLWFARGNNSAQFLAAPFLRTDTASPKLAKVVCGTVVGAVMNAMAPFFYNTNSSLVDPLEINRIVRTMQWRGIQLSDDLVKPQVRASESTLAPASGVLVAWMGASEVEGGDDDDF